MVPKSIGYEAWMKELLKEPPDYGHGPSMWPPEKIRFLMAARKKGYTAKQVARTLKTTIHSVAYAYRRYSASGKSK